MESKFTKGYADKEAKKVFFGTRCTQHEVNAFIYGYLHAIEKTNASELLEALQSMTMQFNQWLQQDKDTIGYKWAEKAIEAINKATK